MVMLIDIYAIMWYIKDIIHRWTEVVDQGEADVNKSDHYSARPDALFKQSCTH